MNEQIIAYKDELLLLSWSDTSRNGQTVTFRVAPGFDVHPFRDSPTGKKSGKRYAAVLVEINDDETPVVQKPKGGPLSKEAAGLCKRRDFQIFAREKAIHIGVGAPLSEGLAADYIRFRCNITSRAELDHFARPANEFAHIKREFHEWKKVAA